MTALDTSSLAAYLRREGLGEGDSVELQALTGGQSNPTYLLASGGWRCVLRTRPPGPLQPSAHAIDREHRVMAALHGRDVPVPRMLAYCADAKVAGREFYLMEWVQGRHFMDQALPGLAPAGRRAIYDEMNRVLAALHAVDVGAAGLQDYGRAGSYFQRQIGRWTRQLQAATQPVGPALRALMDWLPQHLPADDETTLVHGDFRLDNLIFHPSEPRVLAVLDWELSTLGHPLADFAYHCMSWHIPAQLWRGIAGLDLAALGIPSEAAYVQAYARRTGRDPQPIWGFALAYNLFRIAAILHGIGERAARGNAAAADAQDTARRAEPLAEIGWQCALRHEKGLS